MRIYVDNAATTKIHPEVAEAMVSCLNENYGNPSSIYLEGREREERRLNRQEKRLPTP